MEQLSEQAATLTCGVGSRPGTLLSALFRTSLIQVPWVGWGQESTLQRGKLRPSGGRRLAQARWGGGKQRGRGRSQGWLSCPCSLVTDFPQGVRECREPELGLEELLRHRCQLLQQHEEYQVLPRRRWGQPAACLPGLWSSPPCFKKKLYIYFWLCWVIAGQALLKLWRAGATLYLWGTSFSLQWFLLLQSTGSRVPSQ